LLYGKFLVNYYQMTTRIVDAANTGQEAVPSCQKAIKLLPVLLCLMLFLASCGKKEDDASAVTPQKSGADSLQPILDLAKQSAANPANPAKLTSLTQALDFGSVNKGEDLQLPVILANNGDQDLTINRIQFGSEEPAFTMGGACTANTVLGPERSSCRIDVTFAPAEARTYNTRIIITHSAPESPLIIEVSGTGASLAPPPQAVSMVPSELEINAARLLQQRRQMRLQVTSAGDLIDRDVTLEDDDYSALGYDKTISTYPVKRDRLITADRYIPAVLENTINSSLSDGRCIGVVENHVYSAEGANILIPAGSRIIGKYSSLSRAGQSRLEVKWYRLLRPDGVNIDIQSDGADVMGRMGMIGHVDKRYFDRFAMPLLISTIGIAANYASSPKEVTSSTQLSSDIGNNNNLLLGNTTNETRSREDIAARQFTSELLNISREIIRDNIDIAPIITVPAGTRFQVIPTRDIELKRPTLMTAAGPAYDLVAKARNLIQTLQRGELDAAGLRLAEVMASAAQVGQFNESRGMGNNPFTPAGPTAGMNAYAPPTDPALQTTAPTAR
jgi:type IV secretion system protein VirB10